MTAHSTLMAGAAPLALLIGLSGAPANAANLPVPSVPPPSEATQWVNTTVGSGGANTYSVNVSGARAYAEWQSFDVAAGNTFTVKGQTGKDWILVNRVVGDQNGLITPSMLGGTIAANGQVWLLNPSGVVVSNTGVFNVGGLLLSSAGTFDKTSYLQGGLSINFSGATSAIQMNGTVNASGGLVAFLAPVVNIDGTVRETAPGVAQVAAVAARDVSLVFTDTGTQLALDGVTINVGSDVPGACDNPCPTSGGITVGASAQITAGRIVLAAAGAGLTSSIVVSGGLTATQARSDGQDIVLMVADQTSQASDEAPAELSGGSVQSGASTTTGGGDISIDSDRINTLSTGAADPLAAPGASLFVQDSGNVHVGSITNAVGDVYVSAQGNIDQIASRPGDITAGRDINLSVAFYDQDVTLGDLSSARDIAIANFGGGITLSSATAGDDIVMRAYENVSVTGALTTQGNDVSAVTAPNQAGDALAAYAPFNALGSSFALTGSSIDINTLGSVTVGGSVKAAGPLSDVRMQGYGVTVGDVHAGEDILLSAFAYADGPDVDAGNLTAGRDVALIANEGSITVASAMAGDDIVMRAYGDVTVTGSLTTQGADVSATAQPNQPGDLLAAVDPLGVFGQTASLSGSSVDIGAGRSLGSGYAYDGPPPTQNPTGSITVGGTVSAVGPQSDARFSAPTSITLAGVSAGQDVLADTGSGADSTGALITGDLSAGRDVALRSLDGALNIGSSVAGDNIVLRAATSIQAAGQVMTRGIVAPVDPNQPSYLLVGLDPIISFGATFALAGSSIDVKAGTSVMVQGPLGAFGRASDLRIQANGLGGITIGNAGAGEDVLLDATYDQVTAGDVQAGRDVAIQGTSAVSLVSVLAGDDLVLRSYGSLSVAGSLFTLGPDVSTGAAPTQAGDLLEAYEPLHAFGTNFTTAGSPVDVQASGPIVVGGSTIARGQTSDARFVSASSITLGAVTAGQDIAIDATGGAGRSQVSAGVLAAGRDIAIRSSASDGNIGSVALTSAQAGDDIVLRSAGGVTVSGGLKTKSMGVSTTAEPDQAGDLLYAIQPFQAVNTTFALNGLSIDVVSTGRVSIGGASVATGAASDVRIMGFGVAVGGVSAGEDIFLYAHAVEDGPDITAGALVAGRDIALLADEGMITLGSAQAGDDIVLRAYGDINVAGALTTQGVDVSTTTQPNQVGDLLAASDPLSLFGRTVVLAGSSVDVGAGRGGTGQLTVGGPVTAVGAQSDARFTAPNALTLGDVAAGEDVIADTGSAAGSTGTLTTGNLVAGRDVALRSQTGSMSLASTMAGGDIVLRAPAAIGVTGAIDAQNTYAGSDPDRPAALLDSLDPFTVFGTTFALAGSTIDLKAGTTIDVGGGMTATGAQSDIRLLAGGAITTADAAAGEDVALYSGASLLSGALTAGRDIAGSTATALTIGSGDAGDDIILKAGSTVLVNGGLTTHGMDVSTSSASNQAGDLLYAQFPTSQDGVTLPLTGSTIVVEGASGVTVTGPSVANGALSDARFGSQDGPTAIGDVTAGEDVAISSPLGTSHGGALIAGRDIAIGGTSITIGSGSADADIIMRATGPIAVTGALTTTGLNPKAGALAQGFAAASPLVDFGVTFGLTGSTIDLGSSAAISVGGQVTATGAVADARFSGVGVTLAGVNAGRDILIDTTLNGSGAISTGALVAGRDVAVNGSGVTLGSATAGGDIVLRGAGALSVTGGLSTTGTATPSPSSAGAVLAASAPFTAYGSSFALTGSSIDATAGQILTVAGTVGAVGATSDVRLQGASGVIVNAVSAGEDVVLDSQTKIQAGALTAGRDVAVGAGPGSVVLASASAGEAIALRGLASITVNGGLTTQGVEGSGAASLLSGYDPIGVNGTGVPLVGSSIDVKANVIALGPVDAADDVLMSGATATGGVTTGTITAGRDVAMVAGSGGLTLASIAAGDDVVLSAGGPIQVAGGVTTAGADIPATTVPGQAGDAFAALAPFQVFGAVLPLTGSSIEISTSGSISTGKVTAAGAASDARLAAAGSISTGDIGAGEDVLLSSGGAATAGALSAGRDIAVSATGDIHLASGSAADDIVVRGKGSLLVDGGMSTTGNGAAGGLAVAALYAQSPTDDLGVALALSPSSIDAGAAGALSVGGAVASGPAGDVRFVAGSSVALADVSAGRDILIDNGAVDASGDIGAGALTAGRDIAVRSSDAIEIASAMAGDDIVLRAPGLIGVTGFLTTGGQDFADPNEVGRLLYAISPNTVLGGTYTLAGSNIDLVGLQGISVGGQSTASGAGSDARFDSSGPIDLGGVSAGRDIVIDPSGTGADVASGALIAGRDIAIQVLAGSLTIASAQAGDDIVLRSGGALTVSGALTTTGAGGDSFGAGDQLSALDPSHAFWAAGAPPSSVSDGHDIDLRAAGPIALGGVSTVNGAGSVVRIDSYGPSGTVRTAGIAVVGGSGVEQILIAASDLDLTGAIDAPTADVLLFSRATSGVTTLGGPATGLGSSFTFDNTEVARVTAKSLNIFSGVDPAVTGPIAIQDLTFTQGLQTIRAYSGVGSRIDILGVVSDPFSGGRLDVGSAGTDPDRPTFAQAGQPLALAVPWRPDVIRVAGRIGVVGTPLADVSLAAASIYIAPEPDTALATNFEQASQSSAALPLYAGADSLQIAVGTLELRASNVILERNLKTTASGQDRGLELGKLLVDRLDSGGPTPTRVDLYGVINQALNGVLPPPNPDDLVGGDLPALKLVFYPAPNATVLFPEPAGAQYFFNSCALGVACGDLVPTSTTVFLTADSLLEQDALASQALPRIVLHDVQDVIDPYTPIEEEGVTNMGGEVGWLPALSPEPCPEPNTQLCRDSDGDLKTKPSQ